MGTILQNAVYSLISKGILAFVLVPAGILFLAYLIYIIISVWKELRKK